MLVRLQYFPFIFVHSHSVHFSLPSQVISSEIFHSFHFVPFPQLFPFHLSVSGEGCIFPNKRIILFCHHVHLCSLKSTLLFLSILLLQIHISFTVATTSHLILPTSLGFFLLNFAVHHFIAFQINYHSAIHYICFLNIGNLFFSFVKLVDGLSKWNVDHKSILWLKILFVSPFKFWVINWKLLFLNK